MILPKQHLMYSKIMDNMIGDIQYQPAGIDVTLKEIYEFTSAGKVDFDNSERILSEVQPLEFNNNELHLKQGGYKVIFNEYVKIPKNLVGFCFPRSTLLRCGVTLECAVWDPGYEGRSEALLIISNPHGFTVKKDAKIGHMVFSHLVEETVEEYSGRYKGENK
ncbi:MAG: deoxyuridine 5'-triphosphate nucleotidohydrolase [Candidatus ainarchaeum sp.]|nr:deoxyuridine 5'-triphosphate nucleotidohydrolase [Candidatus ainarchaeum sp.]